MENDASLPPSFPGHRYWKTVQGSVDAILAPMGIKRRVVSMGTQFCNYDAWTWIAFCDGLCGHLAKHPTRAPDAQELKDILRHANAVKCRDPHIQVAKMPARVTHRVALAITGGGYHEAWHTKYSKRDSVRLSEVQPIVDMLDEVFLAGGQFDAKMRGLLQTLNHLVEDVRIERRGNEEFPGAAQPMRDLQDFILDLEARGRAKGAKIKNITVSTNARSILLCALRDLGLGYNTHKSRAALDYYKEIAPGAVALLAPGGLLAPYLHEAKTLGADDKTGSLRVGLKIVIALWRATQSDETEEGEMPKVQCPNCGAGPSELVIRSVRDANGVKVHGRAELECKACGFKHEFDLPDHSLNLDQKQPKPEENPERPEIEDLDQEDVGNGSDGFGHDDREQFRGARPPEGKPTPAGGKSPKEDETSEDEGDEGTAVPVENEEFGDDPDGRDDRNPEAEEAADDSVDERDGFDSDPEGDEAEGDEAEGDEEGELHAAIEELLKDSEDSEDSESVGLSGDARGMGSSPERQEGEDNDEIAGDEKNLEETPEAASALVWDGVGEDGHWEMTAEDFLAQLGSSGGAGGVFDLGQDPDSVLERVEQVFAGTEADGLINNMTGLEAAMSVENKTETRDLERGEMPWNPYNAMIDEARVVRSAHQEEDQRRANEMLAQVRETVTFLRARLRNIVRAQEMVSTTHGVRRGRKISNRRLTDTAVELLANENPSRPYQITDASVDTSLAQCLVLDQSGSMYSQVYQVAQTMMVMADCVESIGGKTMALGFRDGQNAHYSDSAHYDTTYHRVHGVRYDIFKMWEEKFINAKWRFAHTQATGGTPMADGIQYGLLALNERREAHRIMWVITDGCPNSPHEKVIARQIRLAKAAGIHVIGIGIGDGAQYVKKLFPDHVWVKNVRDLPQPVVAKLNEVCDFAGRYRGRKAKLDGGTSRKVS
jgi:hypothetical protein